jgi:DHA1 family tetracycline resistance protein-like MFS transporter
MPRISDTFGRRWTLILASLGAAIAFAGSSRAVSFLELVIWRGIAGLFSGSVATVFAYIVDIVPVTERANYMANVTSIISFCFIIGPMIGGGLSNFGIKNNIYCIFTFNERKC